MKSHTSQKGFIMVLLLVVVAVLGIVGFYGLNSFKNNSNVYLKTNSSMPSNQAAKNPSSTPIESNVEINKQILKDLIASGITCKSEDESGNVVQDNCRVDKVVGNFAKGTMPQAYWLAIKTNGIWKVAVTGNGMPACVEIDMYSIPKEIFGNCIEISGELRY